MSRLSSEVVGDDCISIEYRILHRGLELESSGAGQAVDYQLGQGDWPDVLEKALLGAREGDCLSLHFEASDKLFGRPDPARIVDMDRRDFNREPEPGELIEFEMANGERVEGQVLLLYDDKIQVDFNHPYAGRELDIEIRIISIRKKVKRL